MIQLDLLNLNTLIYNDLRFFEHGLDPVRLLFRSNLKLFINFRKWKLYDKSTLIGDYYIMFLMPL